MTGVWLVSYIVLWLLVLGSVALLLALARQIGILHTRLGPTGARITNAGLELGTEAPRFSEYDLNGHLVTLGAERGKSTLLVFISPSCSVCGELAPAIRTLHRHEQEYVEVVVVSMLDNQAENRAYVKHYNLGSVPYLVKPHIAEMYHITSSPYAILVDAEGNIFTKGVVNHIEHLESLLNALHDGHMSYDSKMNQLIIVKD